MTNGMPLLYKQSARGCKLKSLRCNYDGCLGYCTSSERLSVYKKLHVDGIKLSWSLVFTLCYQTCFGVVSQRPAIGFPMKLSPGMRIATCWVPTETGWGLTPTRDTVQRQQRCSRNHSLPRNQEMTLTSGCEIKMGRGKKSHGRKGQL